MRAGQVLQRTLVFYALSKGESLAQLLTKDITINDTYLLLLYLGCDTAIILGSTLILHTDIPCSISSLTTVYRLYVALIFSMTSQTEMRSWSGGHRE